MKRFTLQPTDARKSFYGKCEVTEHDNGDSELRSYDTIVCRIRKGKFERLWKGYSHTTMRHVNAYIEHYGITGGGKKWWDNMEVVKE